MMKEKGTVARGPNARQRAKSGDLRGNAIKRALTVSRWTGLVSGGCAGGCPMAGGTTAASNRHAEGQAECGHAADAHAERGDRGVEGQARPSGHRPQGNA